MGFDPHEPEQRNQLNDALKAADISMGELWLRYFSICGSAGEYEVQAYSQGLISLPVFQRDLLAMAANELIDEKPQLHAPYSDQLNGSGTNGAGNGFGPTGITGTLDHHLGDIGKDTSR